MIFRYNLHIKMILSSDYDQSMKRWIIVKHLTEPSQTSVDQPNSKVCINVHELQIICIETLYFHKEVF